MKLKEGQGTPQSVQSWGAAVGEVKLCALHFFLFMSPTLFIQNSSCDSLLLCNFPCYFGLLGTYIKICQGIFECTLQSTIFPKDLHQLIIATKTIHIDYMLTLTSFDISICQRTPAEALKLPISLLSSIRADDCFQH